MSLHTLPSEIGIELQKLLEQRSAGSVVLQDYSAVSGGSINQTGHLTTSVGDFFLKWNDATLKWNDATRFPHMMLRESEGLALLHAANALRVPAVVGTGIAGGYQLLVLAYIEGGSAYKSAELGEGLAHLHRQTSPRAAYGLENDNYMGSLPQQNTWASSWCTFFAEHRLMPQFKLARQQGLADDTLTKAFDHLIRRLPDMMPEEKPSLVHGDLWHGNVIADTQGHPYLIDPATHYGHREADLAMTRLFGGFDVAFYEAYTAAFPLAPGFADRVDLYNLYPLLVHVNLFGAGYLGAVKSILSRYR